MDVAVSNAACAVIDNDLVPNDLVHAYDPISNTWVRSTIGPTPLYYAAACCCTKPDEKETKCVLLGAELM